MTEPEEEREKTPKTDAVLHTPTANPRRTRRDADRPPAPDEAAPDEAAPDEAVADEAVADGPAAGTAAPADAAAPRTAEGAP
ncbi:hypothetical protein [Plantactinospora sp. KBS50]|uniref:hypothetical protein n=1 Tax=Plantactinospora sp. KBS50 TaxID=2024580 RepID=UPI000BAAACFC|nr:hypothetical protein [Plantactinospora sp. KBS50]ASW55029.1 hypothetical protein CIK06_13825 [Plantactinospora sp. KBS50]